MTFEPGERLNVGQIAEVSTLARSTVSHHLKVLREAGVLGSEKIGKEVYFWWTSGFCKTCSVTSLTIWRVTCSFFGLNIDISSYIDTKRYSCSRNS